VVKRVTANGVDFAYLEAGPSGGPLVLCLHGFPDHAPTFEPLLAALGEAGFHAVAPWLRGYSPTGPAPDGKYHTQSLALDALALTDELAGPRTIDAYLVGSDWGAGAATLAVAHRPDRFKKLVTIAVPPPGVIDGKFLASPDQLKRSWYIWFFGTPLADIAVPMNDFAFIDKIWADWSPGYRMPEPFMRALKDTFAVDGAQAAIGYYRDSMHGRSTPPEDAAAITGGAITIPHLYFHGTDDGCLGADLLEDELVSKSLEPDGEYVLVADAGHFLHLEQPDEVNAKIVSFLKA
jgi:pimeloyl-ACP methyl ester carboxylesterase